MKSIFALEIKSAFRAFLKRPQFAFTVVVTLAIVMTALLSVFSLTSTVLLKDLPYKQSDQLYFVQFNLKLNNFSFGVVPHAYQLFNEQQHFFKDTELFVSGRNKLNLDGQLYQLETAAVSEHFFDMLGSKVFIGRLFDNREQFLRLNPVTVISYSLWQQHFSGNMNVLGQQVKLGSRYFRIIGVLAKDTNIPEILTSYPPQLWLPLDYSQADLTGTKSISTGNVKMLARGDIGHEKQYTQASQQLINKIIKALANPIMMLGQIKAQIQPLREAIIGDADKVVVLLFIAGLGLLFIACVNLANLFLARAIENRRNMAVYLAVGAKKYIYS